ncbi:hypothetical protein TNCV_2317551 [Trichonephila clavipes]|nr:hypothetical protein TNCV_2317551 [Trichonephila clavipes]
MGIPYHPEIKGTVDGIATHILSLQGQSQINAVKAQDYGNNVLGPARCFAGGLYATKKEQRSTQVSTASLYGSFEEHCKTNGVACCQKAFCSSTITEILVGNYSHFIPNYSTIASPLTDALKGKIKRRSLGMRNMRKRSRS